MRSAAWLVLALAVSGPFAAPSTANAPILPFEIGVELDSPPDVGAGAYFAISMKANSDVTDRWNVSFPDVLEVRRPPTEDIAMHAGERRSFTYRVEAKEPAAWYATIQLSHGYVGPTITGLSLAEGSRWSISGLDARDLVNVSIVGNATGSESVRLAVTSTPNASGLAMAGLWLARGMDDQGPRVSGAASEPLTLEFDEHIPEGHTMPVPVKATLYMDLQGPPGMAAIGITPMAACPMVWVRNELTADPTVEQGGFCIQEAIMCPGPDPVCERGGAGGGRASSVGLLAALAMVGAAGGGWGFFQRRPNSKQRR